MRGGVEGERDRERDGVDVGFGVWKIGLFERTRFFVCGVMGRGGGGKVGGGFDFLFVMVDL